MTQKRRHKAHHAFTLAELLIALLILGVIAAFTIPKVLETQRNQQRTAVMRETIATLSQLASKAIREQSVTDTATEKTFFRNNLNYIKLCSADPNTEGCWNGGSSGSAANADAYVLPNGAFITSINSLSADREVIQIDWNGAAPPNSYYSDVLPLTICFGPGTCDTGANAIVGTGPKGPGAVGPIDSFGDSYLQAMFSN